MGNGSWSGKSTTPVDVSGLDSGVTVISAGDMHTCGVVNGGAKCCGLNEDGQLGNGSSGVYVRSTTPQDVSGLTSGVAAIGAGGSHSCALTTGGGVKCWGSNYSGKLGDGTVIDRLTPVAVVGLSSGVSTVSAGFNHNCALVNGGAKCWSDNGSGRLGDGTGTVRKTPVDVSGLGSGSGVTAISAGYEHTCAIVNGGVKCWGDNDYGQLGNGTTDDSYTPVDVSGMDSGVTVIAAGDYHTCAVLYDGIKCWGYNGRGQVGDGTTTTPRKTPVNVVGFTPVVWSLMVYLDADNSLDSKSWLSFNDLESAANNDNVHILVVWDRSSTASAYFEVQYDTDPDQAANYTENVNKWSKGELNMGDPKTLIDFINWTRSNYPAKYYALILDDHGSGLAGAMEDATDSDIITVNQLGAALSAVTNNGSNPIDVLYMYACLMGMIEDAYQFRGYADYYVASENISWAWSSGNVYKEYVDSISTTTTPEQLATAFTTKYGEVCDAKTKPCTMATADMAYLSSVVTATNTLAQALSDGMATHATTLESVGHAVQRFDMNSDDKITSADEYVDLYDFAFLVDSLISDATIQAGAQDVMNAVDDFIIANYTRSTDDLDLGNSYGVSIFWPDTSSSFYTAANYAFAAGATWTSGVGQALVSGQATISWGPMLVNYFQTTDPGGPDNPIPPEAIAPYQEGGAVYLPVVLRS